MLDPWMLIYANNQQHTAARGRLPRNGPISCRAYDSCAGGYNLPRSDYFSLQISCSENNMQNVM